MSAYDPNGNLISATSQNTHDGAVIINASDGGVFGGEETMLSLNTKAGNPAQFVRGSTADRLDLKLSNTGNSASFRLLQENGTQICNIRGISSIIQNNWNPQSSNNFDLGVTATRWRDCYAGDFYATANLNAVDCNLTNDLNYGGALNFTSDNRRKTDITDEIAGLDVLKNINVKSYRLKKDPIGARKHIGIIAQDLKASLVSKGYDSNKVVRERGTKTITRHDNEGNPFDELVDIDMGVDLVSLLSLSINAIKQLEARVAALEG